MSTLNVQPDLQDVINLVLKTKPLIMDAQSSHDVTVKGRADFVTRTDTSVQQFLKEHLAAAWPHIQFLGEENGQNHADFSKPVWILDPIDGTTNLIYNYMHSAVSLGYYENHEVTMGVIYNPFREELFYAQKGRGAYLNGQRIHVSSKSALNDSLIAVGTTPYDKTMAPVNFKTFQRIFENFLDIRRSGSAALDIAYTACGRQDGYFERDLKPWDFSAGAVILSEAGGTVTGFDGPIDFSKNQNIIASNGLIHDELTKAILF